MYSCFQKIASFMKQSRVEAGAHAMWRGLLLVYDCMVFGDTSESVDEVISPRFFYCLNFRDFGLKRKRKK